MEVQFKVMRRHADKAYLLTEITGYDERLPVNLAVFTDTGVRIPSEAFPYCDADDPTEVESVLRDAAVANHDGDQVLVHAKNTADARFFVIVLPWMNIRRWVLEFSAVSADGAVVTSSTKHVDLGSFGLLSMMGKRASQPEVAAMRKLDGRFIHDRVQVSFVRAIEMEEGVLVTARVQMPYHPSTSVDFDFLGDHGQTLPLEAQVIEDTIIPAVDYGSFPRRSMLVTFEVDRLAPRVCLCATDACGTVAPGFEMLGPESLYALMKETALSTLAADEDPDYDSWYAQHRVDVPTLLEQVAGDFDVEPTFSVICDVSDAPVHYVHDLTTSLLVQSYGLWELILVSDEKSHTQLDDLVHDFADERVFVLDLRNESTLEEAVTAGLGAAEGDFILTIPASSTLSSDALFEMVRAINERPDCDLVYGDVDTFDADGAHFDPVFLPDFSPELLRSCNYLRGVIGIRATMLEDLAVPESLTGPAAKYDLALRMTEQARRVCHVPRILTHERYAARIDEWSVDEQTQEAARKALVGHCRRIGLNAEVLTTAIPLHFRVRHVVVGAPLVTIVIVARNDHQQLAACLRSLYTKIFYKNFEVLVVDQNVPDEATRELYESLQDKYPDLSIYCSDDENRSRVVNQAVANMDGEYLLFLNDDARVISEDLVETMLGYFQSGDVGIVGPKRLFVDGTIDHAGLVVGGERGVTPLFRFMPSFWRGYQNRAVVAQNVSAVAKDCMMVKRSLFDEVGGITEELTTAYAGLDFCLKVRELGFYTVFTPHAVLGHFRSVSRIHLMTNEARVKLRRESALVQYLWPRYFVWGDPFYNPNLDPDSPYFALRH